MLICLAGTVGAGKTYLARYLSKFLGTKAFYEPVKGNPVLPRFYQGNQLVAEGKWHTNPYTFLLQIYFLNLRFHMIKEAMANDNDVLDRSIYEDALFMKMNYSMGNTTDEEWKVYKSLLHNMMQELPYCAHKKAPDLLVYINCPLHLELKHIQQRARAYEQVSTHPNLLSYYKNLQHYYAKWYQGYNYSPKMMIHANQYDLHNKKSRLMVLNKIKHKLDQVRK